MRVTVSLLASAGATGPSLCAEVTNGGGGVRRGGGAWRAKSRLGAMTKRTIVRLLHAPFDASGTRSRSRPVDEGWGRQAGRRVLGDESHSHGGRYRAALALRSRCARAALALRSRCAKLERERAQPAHENDDLRCWLARRGVPTTQPPRSPQPRPRPRPRARAPPPAAAQRWTARPRARRGRRTRRRRRRRRRWRRARRRRRRRWLGGGLVQACEGDAILSRPPPYSLSPFGSRRAREFGSDARARRRAAVDRTPLAPLAPVASSRPRARCRS